MPDLWLLTQPPMHQCCALHEGGVLANRALLEMAQYKLPALLKCN